MGRKCSDVVSVCLPVMRQCTQCEQINCALHLACADMDGKWLLRRGLRTNYKLTQLNMCYTL